MRAADHDLAFANARALVDDWITVEGRRLGGLPMSPTYFPRLIAWFSHSPIVLRGADHGFYRRFLKSIALADALSPACGGKPADATRFKARIALAMASLCLPSSSGPFGRRRAISISEIQCTRCCLMAGMCRAIRWC
jgi:uncharacterized heparinase superfamily protein